MHLPNRASKLGKQMTNCHRNLARDFSFLVHATTIARTTSTCDRLKIQSLLKTFDDGDGPFRRDLLHGFGKTFTLFLHEIFANDGCRAALSRMAMDKHWRVLRD